MTLGETEANAGTTQASSAKVKEQVAFVMIVSTLPSAHDTVNAALILPIDSFSPRYLSEGTNEAQRPGNAFWEV
jgi:hypothetical protein